MTEVIEASDGIAEWKKKVLARDSGRCVNCGKSSKVVVCFVVPPEVGGRLVEGNGVTVCRDCRMAADGARVLPQKIDNKIPINFLISKKLHDEVERFVHEKSRFGSVSSLVRHMITSFITAPEMYEDLHLWQDNGSSDVKLNGWADGNLYSVFKHMCNDRRMTYTDALKGLLMVAVNERRAD